MGLNLNLGNINKAAKDFTHRRSEASEETMRDVEAVSYTHLTLPTKLEV